MDEMDSGQNGENEPEVLLHFRRGGLNRVSLCVRPGCLTLAMLLVILALISGQVRSAWEIALMYIWIALVAYSIWHELFCRPVDFTCTKEGIAFTSTFGRAKRIAWSDLRRYAGNDPYMPSGHATLIFRHHPVITLYSMPKDSLIRLEKLVRSHSSAEVKRGGW